MANRLDLNGITLDVAGADVKTQLTNLNNSRRMIYIEGVKTVHITASYKISSGFGYFTKDIIYIGSAIDGYGISSGILKISYSGQFYFDIPQVGTGVIESIDTPTYPSGTSFKFTTKANSIMFIEYTPAITVISVS